MTEAEWLACTDPMPMLDFLRGKASARKLRLFACACCRTVWFSISEVFREAIRVGEEHADGRATDAELGAAVSAAHRVRRGRNNLERAVYDAARSSGNALVMAQRIAVVAQRIAQVVARAAAPNPSHTAESRVVNGQVVTEEIPPNADRLVWNATYASQLRLESSLLRDSVGSLPFRPINLEVEVLTWKDGTVVKLAQGIYNDRAFDGLPILADALEEARCTDPAMLDHCRGPGPHVRGCWVVDLLLGKS
jgi:hypothetical protein